MRWIAALTFAVASAAQAGQTPLPPKSSLAPELRASYDMLANRRSPTWLSYVTSASGEEELASCGGLDLFAVYQRAQGGAFNVTPAEMGKTDITLKIGNLVLLFQSSENRLAYTELLAQGKALPAYGCWCAYGIGHPKHAHWAAPNRALVTLMHFENGTSGLYFNLAERGPSWSANPKACISRAEVAAQDALRDLSLETKRPVDGIFDVPPNSRPLPTEPCVEE